MMREPALPGGGYLGTPAASLSCGSDAVSGERVQVRRQSRGTVYLGLVALARAGRLLECLGAFRGAARLGALRLDELGELTVSLARALGPRELREGPGCAPGDFFCHSLS